MPSTIRAAAALAISIGHLAVAVLALRSPATTATAGSSYPLIGRSTACPHASQADANHASSPLDVMYPSPTGWRGTEALHAAPNQYEAEGQRQSIQPQGLNVGSSLAMALSRASRPAMLMPRSV